MKKIVISEFMNIEAVESLRSNYEVVFDATLVDDPERLKRELNNAHALIVRNRTQVTAELLNLAPHMKVVGRLGVGLDNISLDECKKRAITVIPATGSNDRSVAEYVIGSALILLRNAFVSSELTANGEWPRNKMIGQELSGKVFGFLGFGAIARETARIAGVFNCPLMAHDPFVDQSIFTKQQCENVSLTKLFSSADIISIHLPLTDNTKNLVNRDLLEKMKSTACLINTSRGGIVNELALIDLLRNKKILGAALDVFEHEPIVGEKAKPFAQVRNLLCSPHIAGVTEESNVRVSAMIAKEVAISLG
ncbi:MAG: hydroxyacid dehydrogenase [Methylacidiphilales bacterium]|nr:hydroxyacid dehydrogenase [Candidatus Methylacidiphilales bacterium]